jgi:hypothetical protein
VAVDLLDGTRRLERAPVRGADGRGRLAGVTVGRGTVGVRWRNPDGSVLERLVLRA